MAFTRLFFTDLPGHPSLDGLGSFGAQHPAQSAWGAWPAPDNYGSGNASGVNLYPADAMQNYALTSHETWLGTTNGKIISHTGTVSGLPQYTRWTGVGFGASYTAGGNPTYPWAVAIIPWARFSYPLLGVTTALAGNAINQMGSGALPTKPWMLALAHRGRNPSSSASNTVISGVWFPHCYIYRPSTASIVGWIVVSTFNYNVLTAINSTSWNTWKEEVPGATTLIYPYQSHYGSTVTGVQDGDLFVWEMFHVLQWCYYAGGAIPAGGTIYATHDLQIQGPRIVGTSDTPPGLTYGDNGYPNFASNYTWANEVINGVEPTILRTTNISASLGSQTGSTGLTVSFTP